jgi:hypothetical protein
LPHLQPGLLPWKPSWLQDSNTSSEVMRLGRAAGSRMFCSEHGGSYVTDVQSHVGCQWRAGAGHTGVLPDAHNAQEPRVPASGGVMYSDEAPMHCTLLHCSVYYVTDSVITDTV